MWTQMVHLKKLYGKRPSFYHIFALNWIETLSDWTKLLNNFFKSVLQTLKLILKFLILLNMILISQKIHLNMVFEILLHFCCREDRYNIYIFLILRPLPCYADISMCIPQIGQFCSLSILVYLSYGCWTGGVLALSPGILLLRFFYVELSFFRMCLCVSSNSCSELEIVNFIEWASMSYSYSIKCFFNIQ